MNAFTARLCRSIRWRHACVSSEGDTVFLRINSEARLSVSPVRSSDCAERRLLAKVSVAAVAAIKVRRESDEAIWRVYPSFQFASIRNLRCFLRQYVTEQARSAGQEKNTRSDVEKCEPFRTRVADRLVGNLHLRTSCNVSPRDFGADRDIGLVDCMRKGQTRIRRDPRFQHFGNLRKFVSVTGRKLRDAQLTRVPAFYVTQARSDPRSKSLPGPMAGSEVRQRFPKQSFHGSSSNHGPFGEGRFRRHRDDGIWSPDPHSNPARGCEPHRYLPARVSADGVQD